MHGKLSSLIHTKPSTLPGLENKHINKITMRTMKIPWIFYTHTAKSNNEEHKKWKPKTHGSGEPD